MSDDFDDADARADEQADEQSDEQAGEQVGEQVGEQERAEAAALAAALDGAPHAQDAPEDALATALLMRHVGKRGKRGELPQERSEAILNALLREARPGARPRVVAKVVRLWPLAAGLAAAAALALAWLGVETRSPEAQTATAPVSVAAPPTSAASATAQPLPPASVQLLAAQTALLRAGLQRARPGESPGGADAAARETEAAARFERELRSYRAELLRTLQAQYPAKLGLLESAAESAAEPGPDGASFGREPWRRAR
ncbi:MAG TPA: hypothetical protein VK509_24215 [Polyangiales bacterium]|nr:hypothetical protein [Polyangiales bacterium]